jgi:hypothetical protein
MISIIEASITVSDQSFSLSTGVGMNLPVHHRRKAKKMRRVARNLNSETPAGTLN